MDEIPGTFTHSPSPTLLFLDAAESSTLYSDPRGGAVQVEGRWRQRRRRRRLGGHRGGLGTVAIVVRIYGVFSTDMMCFYGRNKLLHCELPCCIVAGSLEWRVQALHGATEGAIVTASVYLEICGWLEVTAC